MPDEIERRFLISAAQLKNFLRAQRRTLDSYSHDTIKQGYLYSNEQVSIRLRQRGEVYTLNFKHAIPERADSRRELEVDIPKKDFEQHWPDTKGRRIEKTRYLIPLADGQHTVELDIFEGALDSHLLAEVEFDSAEAADAFQPPAWFGKEVTTDTAYLNTSLALHGWPADR